MPEKQQYDPHACILLATRNQGKIREFTELLRPFAITVLGLDLFPHVDDVEENGASFAENALLKARWGSTATGLVTIADDSGLEVDALHSAPGIYSARYSAQPGLPATDARNIEKVLKELADVPTEQRGARFRCCIAASAPSGEEALAEGSWEGRVALYPAGENGFGYDPVFIDPEKNCTAAEMSKAEKNARSHRAKAVAALIQQWPLFWSVWLGQTMAR